MLWKRNQKKLNIDVLHQAQILKPLRCNTIDKHIINPNTKNDSVLFNKNGYFKVKKDLL